MFARVVAEVVLELLVAPLAVSSTTWPREVGVELELVDDELEPVEELDELLSEEVELPDCCVD